MFCQPYPEVIYLIYSSYAPHLLYYSHIPAAIVALLLSGFIFFQNRHLLEAKILGIIAILFSAWSVVDLFVWTKTNAGTVMYLWSFWYIFFCLLFVLGFYFLYVFIKQKDIPFVGKIVGFASILPLVVISVLGKDFSSFDVTGCNAVATPLVLFYTYGISLLYFLVIFVFAVKEYIKAESSQKNKVLFVSLGILLFLISFSIASYISDISSLFQTSADVFNIEQYGYFGMTILIGFLTYTIVQYKAFNIKLIAAQALVVSLIILIGSQFFFIQNPINKILNAITLALSAIFGYLLVRSVKREIEAKEKVEKLAAELEQANIQQESLIRFIGHEMKGYLTTSAGVFASMVEGDFGQLGDMLKTSAETALAKVREGVRSIVEILSNANAKKGTLTYKMQSFDFGKMVLAGIAKLLPEAQEKGLVLETGIKGDDIYMVTGDVDQLSEHVVRNLIDNSIKYTPTGSIHIDLSKQGDKVLLSIRDTGVGITMEDKARLFTEGGRGKNSLATNVHSTGYGLAIAKKIVDAHSGRIWVESEGQGKGSQFYVELPAGK